jgi:hypothetical protein
MSKEMREQINRIKNFGQFLNENVNQSTKPKQFYDKLNSEYNHVGMFNRPTGEFLETIDFIIKNDFTQDFLNFLDKNGWYVAKHNNQNKGELKPIYSIEGAVDKIPTILLHATPTINNEDILNDGIKSSSEDLRHKYPNRIYLTSKLITIKQLIVEMKRYSGINDYSIFKIDGTKLNTTLYKDDTCSYFDCYYIQDYNIPNSIIQLMK